MATAVDSKTIEQVVNEVLSRLNGMSVPPAAPNRPASNAAGTHGVFADVDSAATAARAAQRQLGSQTIADRGKIISIIRREMLSRVDELGRMEFEETKIGKLDHKFSKLRSVSTDTPGIDFLKTDAWSGDNGITLNEYAPFGVIGVITPVTHSVPTLVCNAINMIAAGNALLVNPHPGGARSACAATEIINRAIAAEAGIDNLICIMREPTLESAQAIFQHRDVAMICVTGGPGLARAALAAPKKAVVAGPGNPPVVVDETADVENAADSIIKGAAYDNNLLCIGEKEIFAVDSIFEPLRSALRNAGAYELNTRQINALVDAAFVEKGSGGGCENMAVNKDYVGQDASILARAAGAEIPDQTELLFGITDEHSPFVYHEQMMPFIPLVKCRNVDQAIDWAVKYEHGYRHTAIIHSRNVETMTKMGKAMDCTLYVKNGPSFASLGVGGEGYLSYSIATPTGEGVTNPLTFTRQRRCTMVDHLRIV